MQRSFQQQINYNPQYEAYMHQQYLFQLEMQKNMLRNSQQPSFQQNKQKEDEQQQPPFNIKQQLYIIDQSSQLNKTSSHYPSTPSFLEDPRQL